MVKEKKLRYIVEFDVNIETFQLQIVETRFEIARHIYNACKGKMLENIFHLRDDEEFQFWIREEKSEERLSALRKIRVLLRQINLMKLTGSSKMMGFSARKEKQTIGEYSFTTCRILRYARHI